MQQYDVAIIGSGIAGSTLAAILARHGRRVIVFEAGQHPRFSIGESMILETGEMMRALAEFYDVPEIAYFSSENFRSKAGSSHGVKRHFGFWHHRPNQPHDPAHTLQAVIPKQPHGHEFHLYRQDCDQYMMMSAVRYGATVLQRTRITNVEVDHNGVTVTDDTGRHYSAEFIVDAGGFRSVLAQKFDLRVRDQQTHSRGLFTHMVGVQPVEREGLNLPFPMHEGTMHHVFDGGWLWVIPFDNFKGATNPATSVGLMLDPRKHPQDDSVSAEEEFFRFVEQYPSMRGQFANARPTRDWVRAPRIQYGSKRVVGDRWALLGHAAGFIDPLSSKGLYVSMTAIFMLAHQLLNVEAYRRDQFMPLERLTLNYLKRNDRLVANSYRSWEDNRLWQNYSVLWLLGAYTELVKLNTMRAMSRDDRDAYVAQLIELELCGGGFDDYFAVSDQIDAIMAQFDAGDIEVAAADRRMKHVFATVSWMPRPFADILNGKTYLPRAKIRLDIFKPGGGFMGSGDFREHFFGRHTLPELIRAFSIEKARYSELAIRTSSRWATT